MAISSHCAVPSWPRSRDGRHTHFSAAKHSLFGAQDPLGKDRQIDRGQKGRQLCPFRFLFI